VIPLRSGIAAEDTGMMGERMVMQDSLFYEFRLEQHVPADHQLRMIDRFVGLSDLRRHLAAFYSATGRSSVDPELMIRMLIVGYCYGIRSERRESDVFRRLAPIRFRGEKLSCLQNVCNSSFLKVGTEGLTYR
jgi:hypothetical protein